MGDCRDTEHNSSLKEGGKVKCLRFKNEKDKKSKVKKKTPTNSLYVKNPNTSLKHTWERRRVRIIKIN